MAHPKGKSPRNSSKTVTPHNLTDFLKLPVPLFSSMAEKTVRIAKKIAAKMHRTWGMTI